MSSSPNFSPVSYYYITVKSVCVFPHFFEPNQNGHNSINFKAITSRFCMVVDLEEEDEDRLKGWGAFL